MKPLVSVCIANYNGIGLIDTCIESVRNQDCELPVEIIVHDDASTDESVSRIRQQHQDVQLIESDTNVGFCAANNRMADAANGDYLLLLNNDAALLQDAIITLYKAASDVGGPAVLGLPQYDADSDDLLDNGSLLDPFLNPVPNRDLTRHDVGMIMGACLWLPSALWRELGGFPNWFESIAEDLYLCLSATLAGYPVLALGKSGYKHKVGRSFGGGKITHGKLRTTYGRRALSERNKSFTMVICYPTVWLFTLFPLHLLLLTLEGLSLSLIKKDRRIWNDVYAFTLTAIWKQKKRLQLARSNTQKTRRHSRQAFAKGFIIVPYKLRMLFSHGIPEIG